MAKSTIGEYIEQRKRVLKEQGFTVIYFKLKDMLDFIVRKVVFDMKEEGYDCRVTIKDSRTVFISAKKVR